MKPKPIPQFEFGFAPFCYNLAGERLVKPADAETATEWIVRMRQAAAAVPESSFVRQSMTDSPYEHRKTN